ncbi:MAG: thioredoxin family protein, partial [Minisyncoccia bacterium]
LITLGVVFKAFPQMQHGIVPVNASAPALIELYKPTNLDKIFIKAKKENKPIFIYCYVSHCDRCSFMKKNILTNDTLGEFYNDKFICLFIDMEKKDGIKLAKKYEIKCNLNPVCVFLSKEGDLLCKKTGILLMPDLIEIGAKIIAEADEKQTVK